MSNDTIQLEKGPSTTPPALQAQLDSLQEAAKRSLGKPEASPEQPVETPATPEPATPEQAPAPDPEPVPASGQEPAEPAIPVSPAPVAAGNLEQELAKTKHSLSVMQGKYNAEVGRVQQEVRELRQQLQERDLQLQSFVESGGPVAEEEITAEMLRKEYGLTEDQADYTDLYDGVRKITRKEIQRSLDQRVEPVQEELGRIQEENRFQELSRLSPNWETLNSDPAFLEWINQGSGSRKRHLRDDFMSGDLQAVADTFNEYEKSHKPSAPAESPTAESHVSPQTVPGAQPVAEGQQKPTYTTAQFDEYMTNITKGRYPPNQAQKLKAELHAAVAEGRVRPA